MIFLIPKGRDDALRKIQIEAIKQEQSDLIAAGLPDETSGNVIKTCHVDWRSCLLHHRLKYSKIFRLMRWAMSKHKLVQEPIKESQITLVCRA